MAFSKAFSLHIQIEKGTCNCAFFYDSALLFKAVHLQNYHSDNRIISMRLIK